MLPGQAMNVGEGRGARRVKRSSAILGAALVVGALLVTSSGAHAAPQMVRPSINASPDTGKPGAMVMFTVYGPIDNGPQAIVYWCTAAASCSPGGAETKICTATGKVVDNKTVCYGRIPKNAKPLGQHGLLGFQPKDNIQAHGSFTLT